jgi:ABC-type glycerol-3-phosphate transport system substrate-binding protein
VTSTNHRTIAGIAGGILASLAALTACGTTSSTPAAHRPPSIAAQEKTWLASGGRAQTQRVITDLKTIQRDANNYDMAIDQVKADGSQLNADAKLAQGNLPPGPAHQDYASWATLRMRGR